MAKLDITGLEEALARLKEAYDLYQRFDDDNPAVKEMMADSCVKRFEFTYEMAKKTMSRFLKLYYDKSNPPLPIDDIFREMSGLGHIKDFFLWRDYRRIRNDTSHEYDRAKSYEVLPLIPQFADDVGALAASLRHFMESEDLIDREMEEMRSLFPLSRGSS